MRLHHIHYFNFDNLALQETALFYLRKILNTAIFLSRLRNRILYIGIQLCVPFLHQIAQPCIKGDFRVQLDMFLLFASILVRVITQPK